MMGMLLMRITECFMPQLVFTLTIIVPIFLIIFLGWWLRYRGMIDERFVTLSSALVFKVAMPTLVFLNVAKLDFSQRIDFSPIVLSLLLIVVLFVLIWLIGMRYIKTGRDLGVFIQGSYRSNFGIIGLAIANSLYGEPGLALAALYLAFVIPVFNVLAIISLTVPLGRDQGLSVIDLVSTIVKNPLILGVFAGLCFAVLGVPMPILVEKTAVYLADLTLPLALIGVGGILQIRDRGYQLSVMIATCVNKLVIFPIIGTAAAMLLGFDAMNVVIVFILYACPTAAASFIMADALGGNRQLAGASVVFSTVFSAVTLTVGLMALGYMGYLPSA